MALFLTEADRYDPADLAAALPSLLPVLVTCSDADIQISCTDVECLNASLDRAHTRADFIRLSGVDHVLKQDPSRTATNYGNPLLFSPQLHDALHAWAGVLTREPTSH
jgi:hypothetical protein